MWSQLDEAKMKAKTIGIRELKGRLSAYLQEVKSGRTILITEHGRPIGQITPITKSVEERLHDLATKGNYTWSGKKLKAGRPLNIKIQGKKTISDIVLENRD